MVSVTENFPVYYLDTSSHITSNKRASAVSSISSYREDSQTALDHKTYEESDIDTASILQSIPVKSPDGLRSDSAALSSAKDESLMQWLMTQFKQNGLDCNPSLAGSPTSRKQIVSQSKNRPNDFWSASIPKLPTVSDNKSSDVDRRNENWVQSCSRLEKMRKNNELYYPRLPRSRNQSRETVGKSAHGSIPKDSITNIDKMLDDMKLKANLMTHQNREIDMQLQKASHILGNWNANPRRVSSQTNNSRKSPMDFLAKTGRSPIANGPEQFLSSKSPLDSSGADSFITVYRGDLPNTSCHNSPSTTTKWNVHHNYVENYADEPKIIFTELTESHPHRKFSQPLTHMKCKSPDSPLFRQQPPPRCLSAAPNPNSTRIPFGSRKDSAHGFCKLNGVGPSSVNPRWSKPSWFGRASSQISVEDQIGSANLDRSLMRSPGTTPTLGSQTTLGSQNQSAKGFAAFMLRPFRKKASTPGPEPLIISSPTNPMASGDRCVSLVHLADVRRDEQRLCGSPTKDPKHSPNYLPYPMPDFRIRSEELLDNTEPDNTSYGRLKSICSGKARTKKELDADSGVYSIKTPWRV